MDAQQFIASGLIELYALGIASPAEAAEGERMAAEYPAVRRELEKLQTALERYGTLHTVRPPDSLRAKILQIPSGVPNVPDPEPERPVAPVRQPVVRTPRRASSTPAVGVPKWVFAAIGTLLLALMALFWYLLNANDTHTGELDTVRTELAEEKARYTTLETDCAETREELDGLRAELQFLQDPNTNPVELTPLRRRRNPAQAIVYWNAENNQARVNPINLPAIDGNQTYQLWAETPRGLLSIGTFQNQPATFQTVDFEEGAVNLYVSLEPLGGSETPTQGQVKLLGKI